MKRVCAICGSAVPSDYNVVFLDSLEAALAAVAWLLSSPWAKPLLFESEPTSWGSIGTTSNDSVWGTQE